MSWESGSVGGGVMVGFRRISKGMILAGKAGGSAKGAIIWKKEKAARKGNALMTYGGEK